MRGRREWLEIANDIYVIEDHTFEARLWPPMSTVPSSSLHRHMSTGVTCGLPLPSAVARRVLLAGRRVEPQLASPLVLLLLGVSEGEVESADRDELERLFVDDGGAEKCGHQHVVAGCITWAVVFDSQGATEPPTNLGCTFDVDKSPGQRAQSCGLW